MASSKVAGNRSSARSMAGCRIWIERPRSPCSTLPRKTTYCTGSGLSSPNSARTRFISEIGASGGSISGTGSPDSRIVMKTIVTMPQRAISARKTRRVRNCNMLMPSSPPDSPPDSPIKAEHLFAEFHRLVRVGAPVHVGGHAVTLDRVDHRQPRVVDVHDLLHALVGCLADLGVHRE